MSALDRATRNLQREYVKRLSTIVLGEKSGGYGDLYAYVVFFNGASKRPPYDTKGRVETLLKRLGDDRTLTFAQRYRYNSLAARYNAFRDLWRRTMQGREEGRDALSAARATTPRSAR